MTKMTYANAIARAIAILGENTENDEIVNRLNALKMTIEKRARKPMSEEQKEAVNAKRRAANAEKRAALIAQVVPVLTNVMSVNDGYTAKEIFERATANLPADFTPNKVQNVLLNEMAGVTVKEERKGKANLYRLA